MTGAPPLSRLPSWLTERVACIPPPGTGAGEAERLIHEAGCRVAELRLDLQSWSPGEAGGLVESLSSKGVRVIVTLREEAEGGRYRGGAEEKLSLLGGLLDHGAWLADVEYGFPLFDEAIKALGGRVLASIHFTSYTPWPEVLYSLAGDMIRRGARIAKVVAYARSLEDNWKILGVNVRWPGRATGFAMGPRGRLSRVLAPLMGGALVYAPLGRSVAPGQLSLEQLVEAWTLLGAALDGGGDG